MVFLCSVPCIPGWIITLEKSQPGTGQGVFAGERFDLPEINPHTGMAAELEREMSPRDGCEYIIPQRMCVRERQVL